MKMTNMRATASSTSPCKKKWQNQPLPRWVGAILLGGWLSSCSAHSAPAPRNITLQQQWTLNPGDAIAGHAITGSLGDISLQIKGAHVRAPFDGEVEPGEVDGCTFFSTPEIPAYLFRLCGLERVNYGSIKAQKSIGKGEYLSFATLRRQPEGTWVIVEPARDVLEKALSTG